MNALVHSQEYRKLWYKKYKYRIQVRNRTAGLVRRSSYIQYYNDVQSLVKKYGRLPIFSKEMSEALLSQGRYNLLRKYFQSSIFHITRVEGRCYSLFTNDEDILKKFTSAFTLKKGKPNFTFTVTEAIYPDLTEGETIYFKNDPPAMYRIFLKDSEHVEKSIGQLSSTIEKYSAKDNHLIPNWNLGVYLRNPANIGWTNNLNVDVKSEEYLFLFLMTHQDIVKKYSKLKKIPG